MLGSICENTNKDQQETLNIDPSLVFNPDTSVKDKFIDIVGGGKEVDLKYVSTKFEHAPFEEFLG